MCQKWALESIFDLLLTRHDIIAIGFRVDISHIRIGGTRKRVEQDRVQATSLNRIFSRGSSARLHVLGRPNFLKY